MAFKIINDYIAGRKNVPTPSGCCVAAPRFVQAVEAADAATGSAHAIGILPAGYTPALALIVDGAGLSAAAAVSVGILNAAGTDLSTDARDGGGPWAAGVGVGGASSVAQPLPTAALLAVQKTGVDRRIAVKFTTASTAAGTLGLTVAYRSNV